MRRGGFPQLLAGTLALAFGFGLVMIALITLVAVFASDAGARTGDGYVVLLLNPGEGVSVLDLLLHNTLTLGPFAVIGVVLAIRTLRSSSVSSSAGAGAGVEQAAFTVAATRALALVGFARRKPSASPQIKMGEASPDQLVYFYALAATVLAMLGQAWQLGQIFGGLNIVRASTLDLMSAFPHSPPEMAALAVPLAVMLVCASRRRRAKLPQLLAATLPLAFLLLVFAAFLEAYAPTLVAI